MEETLCNNSDIMLTAAQFFEFFIVGLFSTAHCLIMCGAIVGALTVSLPMPVREQRGPLFRYLTAYNIGRIASYAVAGLMVGAFGEVLVRIFDLDQQHSEILMLISGLFLVGIGLHIAGWLPGMALLEKIGNRLWRALEPFAQSLLPVQSPARAMMFGLIWGWFPCGLTYAVLLWTATTGDAIKGALAMTAFGLGTFPGILMASFFSGRLLLFRRSPWVKRGLGLAIILWAVVIGFMDMQHRMNGMTDHSADNHGMERMGLK